METIEFLIGVVLISLLNIICFIIGAKVGQKSARGETIELPKPIQAIKEYQENKEIEKEEEKYRIIAENIDNYNGTPYGQQEIPR